MNWKVYAEYMQQRWSKATDVEKFRMATYLYEGLPYEGGKENPLLGADCSGTVCGPLYLMGYDIRVNANDLFKLLFTVSVPDNETGNLNKIMAVFYKTWKETKHFGKTVPPGYVIHVAPVVGHWCVLDARETVEVWTAANSRTLNERLSRTDHWREIDWKALKEMSASGRHCHGIDSELVALRGKLGGCRNG